MSKATDQTLKDTLRAMPRISQDLLNATFYLYPDLKSAENGESCGGTGFLVSHPTATNFGDQVPPNLYAVTNRHVAMKGGNSVMRLTRRDGKLEIIEQDPSDWQHIPGGNDVAVADLTRRPNMTEFSAVPMHRFVTQEEVQRCTFGPGEDVFMIGRFVAHDGGKANQPVVRFGNIGAMPSPILLTQSDNKRHECYCIDMRSRAGFSGSPVFLYRVFGQDLEGNDMSDLMQMIATGDSARCNWVLLRSSYLGLLGIHCGQFPEKVMLQRFDDKQNDSVQAYVDGVSGMTIVVPAWDIQAVLDIKKFKERRIEREVEFLKSGDPSMTPEKLESALRMFKGRTR